MKKQNEVKSSVVSAENFKRTFEHMDKEKIPINQFVKYLRKDTPVAKAAIPSSFEPVEIVKQLSDAGKAALEAQESQG